MKEFFWCIEYVATFIEIFMCSYFCGTFVAKEKLSGSKNKIVLLSTIASVIVFILNHINLFSYITTSHRLNQSRPCELFTLPLAKSRNPQLHTISSFRHLI